MTRVAGHIMVILGIVTGPPVWDAMARGGLWPTIAFAGVLTSIASGLVLTIGTRRSKENGRHA
jgi:hypothetical protein